MYARLRNPNDSPVYKLAQRLAGAESEAQEEVDRKKMYTTIVISIASCFEFLHRAVFRNDQTVPRNTGFLRV